MPNPKALQELVSYLPRALVADLASHPDRAVCERLDEMQGAVLFADIAGFTPLVKKYSELGPRGTEQFTLLLNNYFGEVIDCVTAWGGDVEKIAGDAIVVFWSVPESGDLDIHGITLQASRCALELQDRLSHFEVADGVVLNARVAIVAGRLLGLRIGGVEGRWQYLLAGEPMNEIDGILHQAEPGETVVSASAWSNIEKICSGRALDGGGYILASAGSLGGRTPYPPVLPPLEVFSALSSFVPRSLRKRLAASQHEWLSELRPVTVLFVSLEGLECHSAADLAAVQDAMSRIQRVLYAYGGSLRQFTMDDKGPLAMALFGLPLHTHEDDAARCLMAALDMHEELDSIHLNCRCGVASGTAFCGTVGSHARREYAIIASAANHAARLMRASNTVACDEATARAAAGRLGFKDLPPLELRGFDRPVNAFQPYRDSGVAERLPGRLVGREAEIAEIEDALDGLASGGGSRVVLLTGEPGLGKSHLLEHARWLARERGLRVISASSDSLGGDTPYLAWRPVFSELFSLERDSSGEEALRLIAARLGQDGRSAELAPLLDDVLHLQLPESELSSQMRGDVRAENTRQLLLEVLRQETVDEPLILMFDDCHHADASSWQLMVEACSVVGPLLLILALRPSSGAGQTSLERIAGMPGTRHIELGALGRDEVARLLAQSLAVDEMPGEVVAAIHEHSDGNAYFCQELGYALRDAGIIVLRDRQCEIAGSLGHFTFPATVEKVINGRVDALEPEHQLTLKVASVIGRVFELQSLSRIHPIESDRPRLPEYLDALATRDFTPQISPPPEQRNTFKHAITQEVLYSQLLLSQRRQLHQVLAEWLELKHAGQIERYCATLAHHWKCAARPQQAFPYHVQAAELALRAGAYPESARLYEEALALVDEVDPRPPHHEVARLRRMLGEARLSMGDFSSARAELEQALRELGRPWPAGTVAPLLREALRQLMHRFGLMRGKLRPEIDREESYAVEFLGHIFYFNEENLENVLSNLRGLNRLERLGPSARLASAYVQVGVIFSVVGLSGLADRYLALGRRTLPEDADAMERMMFCSYSALITLPRADWAESERSLAEMHELAERLGDQHRLRYNRSMASIMRFQQGRIEEAAGIRSELLSMARDAEKQIRCWAAIEWAEVQECLGNPVAAMQAIADVSSLLEERGSTEKIWLRGLRARLLLATGAHAEAREEALASLALMQSSPPTGFYALEGYAATAEVLLDLAAGTAPDGRDSLRASAKDAAACLKRFARVFPVGRPRSLIVQGRLAEFGGAGRGQRAFAKALGMAQAIGMPREALRAQALLAPAESGHQSEP